MLLEKSLLTFQMDKDRLTAEIVKIPESHSKSHNQLQRKNELEQEINRAGTFLSYFYLNNLIFII